MTSIERGQCIVTFTGKYGADPVSEILSYFTWFYCSTLLFLNQDLLLYFLDGDSDVNVSRSSHNVDVSTGETTAAQSSEALYKLASLSRR